MRIVIEGAGEVGSHLAKMLSSDGSEITVIDRDETRLSKLRSTADVVTICGNISSPDSLKRAEIEKAELFIAVNPKTSQDVNVVSALLAKKLGCPKVCARIDDEEYIANENKYLFKEMGIDIIFHPEKAAAEEVVNRLLRSSASDSMDFARGKLKMNVFRIDEDSLLLDLSIRELDEQTKAAGVEFKVVAISRNNLSIIPGPDTKLKYNDLVFIICKRDAVAPMMEFLGRRDIQIKQAMIMGGGTIGQMVAKNLSAKIDEVKVIDFDRKRCLELSEKTDDNVNVVFGDGRNSDFLLEENIRDYDAFIAVTGNDEENILACIVARRFGVPRTIAQVENLEYIRLAEEMGVDAVINKKLITAARIFRLTLSNKVRFIKYMSGTSAEVMEYITAPGSLITKGKLSETGFPEDAIIGGVIRGSESFLASADTQIEAYDRVAVFASAQAAKEVDRFFK